MSLRLLDLPQAKYFCAPSALIKGAVGSQSLATFHASLSKKVMLLKEGTSEFEVHQVNLINSIDRWLVFSLANYRRSIDMLVPISAPWAQVTLYYASFFAANAILGIFGGWIGHTQNGHRVLDVEHGVAGSQELRIYRNLKSPSGAKGSHQAFWDFFYDGAATISAWAPIDLAPALSPVNGNFGWQIMERNNVNYDMSHAWTASMLFQDTFKPQKLKSLRGPLQLQLETAERMIKLAMYFGSAVSLSAESLVDSGAKGTPIQIQRKLASQTPPNLVTQSQFRSLLDL